MPETVNQPTSSVPDHSVVAAPQINRTREVIAELEALSTPMPDNIEAEGKVRHSSELATYSRGFAYIDFESLISKLKAQNPEEPLLAADIGGNIGTAAAELQTLGCVSFVIDPHDSRSKSNATLPPERFIQRRAEDMEGIPDNCFGLIVSFNVLSYSRDLKQAIHEITRVLKPGGVALIDIEWWMREAECNVLRGIEFKEGTSIDLLHFSHKSESISQIPIAKALALVDKTPEADRIMIGMTAGSSFLIRKA